MIINLYQLLFQNVIKTNNILLKNNYLFIMKSWIFSSISLSIINLINMINILQKNQFFFFFCNLRGTSFRTLYKFFFWIFVFANCFLGWLGAQVVETPFIQLSIITTLFYFIYLLILLPLIEIIEKLIFFNNHYNYSE